MVEFGRSILELALLVTLLIGIKGGRFGPALFLLGFKAQGPSWGSVALAFLKHGKRGLVSSRPGSQTPTGGRKQLTCSA